MRTGGCGVASVEIGPPQVLTCRDRSHVPPLRRTVWRLPSKIGSMFTFVVIGEEMGST